MPADLYTYTICLHAFVLYLHKPLLFSYSGVEFLERGDSMHDFFILKKVVLRGREYRCFSDDSILAQAKLLSWNLRKFNFSCCIRVKFCILRKVDFRAWTEICLPTAWT